MQRGGEFPGFRWRFRVYDTTGVLRMGVLCGQTVYRNRRNNCGYSVFRQTNRALGNSGFRLWRRAAALLSARRFRGFGDGWFLTFRFGSRPRLWLCRNCLRLGFSFRTARNRTKVTHFRLGFSTRTSRNRTKDTGGRRTTRFTHVRVAKRTRPDYRRDWYGQRERRCWHYRGESRNVVSRETTRERPRDADGTPAGPLTRNREGAPAGSVVTQVPVVPPRHLHLRPCLAVHGFH
mmetsp:Transcript_11306/g.37368  ORF Transcript_11306/g.37368 Transcript_11306/m.37368 type:complete len:234 (+) Transcript_11306:3585-4286(+)